MGVVVVMTAWKYTNSVDIMNKLGYIQMVRDGELLAHNRQSLLYQKFEYNVNPFPQLVP